MQLPGRLEPSTARSAAPRGLSPLPAGDSTASLSPSCSCRRASAWAGFKSQQKLGKGSGEAQSLWDFWPGQCFPSPRGHSAGGGSTAQSQE